MIKEGNDVNKKKGLHIFNNSMDTRANCMSASSDIHIYKYKRVVLPNLKKEDGFIEIPVLGMAIILIFLVIIMVMALVYGIQTKLVTTYDWFGEAMNYAAQASNMDGDVSMVALRTAETKQYFKSAFADMIEGSVSGDSFIPNNYNYYPGNIEIKSFESVVPGDPVPGGTANQPGYMAVIEVPVFNDKIPFNDKQYVSKQMRYFAVVKSTTTN
ncbi:hypothetical protein V6C27_13855 [Peptococcaceae bacterium 1198_IL3148]